MRLSLQNLGKEGPDIWTRLKGKGIFRRFWILGVS